MSSSSSSKTEGKKPVIQTLTPFPKTKLLQTPSSQIIPSKNPPLFSSVLQQSKLITPQNSPRKPISPFSKTPASKPTSPTIPKTSYIVNPNYQRIQILEDYQISKLSKGFHILSDHLFGPGNTFINEPYKTREYYQTILECSGSIKFNHRSNSPQGSIDYSKAHIFKIISPEEWGPHPYSEKILVGYTAYPRYSYYDYQEAWFKAFLIRNFSHSWFIFFDLNFDYQYPRWFVNWYKFMGLLPSCLPEEIYKGFSKFKELFVQDIPEFEYLLQFTTLFKIPWILTWTYHYQEANGISPPWLNRQFRSKWWDKFKISQANEDEVIKHYQQINPQEKFIKKEDCSDSDLMTRILRASPRSSPADLQKLIQDIRSSPPESEGTPSINTDLFQDAQDPFNDPYED